MAYQAPLNGGRINASIGGNSTSAGAGYKLISTGTMVLAGGTNITLSQNGSTISIVGGAGGGGVALANSNTTVSSGTAQLSVVGGALTISGTNQSFNFSAPAQSSLSATGALSITYNGSTVSIGAPAFSVGVSSNSTVSNRLILAAGTNITLSQSTNASGATISIAGAAGGGGSINFSAGTTSGNLASVTFANSNGIGFGLNAGTITASHNALTTQTAQTQSNIQGIIASGSTNLTGNISFANSNGVTFGLSNNTLTASAGGIALAGGGSTVTGGTATLTGGGAITVTAGANSVFSINGPAQSSLSVTGALSMNTVGSTINIGAAQSSLVGVNGITVSTSGSTISISGNGGGGGGASSVNFSAGTTSGNLASVTFANSNGVSFGLNGGTITASAAGGGGGGGVAVFGGGASYSSGTVNIGASGALTISSNTGQALNFSVPGASSFAGGNGISLISSGSTISIVGGSAPTLSRWEYPNQVFTGIGVPINSSISLQHEYIPFNLSGVSAKIGVSFASVGTFTSATTASQNYSLAMGVYSLSGSSLYLVTSGSALNAFSWGNTASSSSYSNLIFGIRQLTVPMPVNLTAGEYWMAAQIYSASTVSSAVMSIMGNDRIHGTGVVGIIGSSTSAGRDAYLAQGLFPSVGFATLPNSIAVSAINNTSVSYAQRAAFYHAMYNATY